MSHVDFNRPETLEQLEAIGALNKALFVLAEAYGLQKPAQLIADTGSMASYQLGELLEKQNKPADTIDAGKTGGAGEDDDKPINLDDIPF